MIYILKHKNISVLEIEVDNETSSITKIIDVFDSNHIPLGIHYNNGILDRKMLNKWLFTRNIPASRENIATVLQKIDEPSPQNLITKCFALSLSDSYWICPKNENLLFEDINFFENEFSLDMGNLLFGKNIDSFNLQSPDNTSDGWLKKKWIIENKERFLIKGASGVFKQEPFNEKIASKICKTLNIPHVDYDVRFIDELPYSICKDFLSQNTELIPAWAVYNHFTKPNHVSTFDHLVESYQKIGIQEAQAKIEKMIVLDFIIANTDRHMNNFGIIRDSETLEFLDVAPIYDSGTSLFMSTPISKMTETESKPFAKTHSEQIKLVKDFNFLKAIKDDDILNIVSSILNENEFLDQNRKDFIIENVNKRIQILKY